MVRTEQLPVVTDAGPLIHLDELGCLDLLADLGSIIVPRAVWSEVTQHRSQLAPDRIANLVIVDDVITLSPRLATLADSLSLDAGERAALALAEECSARLLLCDDAAARLAAESLGFAVHGTIGIIVRTIRTGARKQDQVLALLRTLPNRSTLHVARDLLARVVATIENS